MLTGKERIGRILRHQPVDRVGLFEVFWKETARLWTDEGHLARPEAIGDHFPLDLRRTGGEITPQSWKLLDLVADLDAGERIVEETDTVKLVRDGNGALLRWLKDVSGAPEHVDFLVKERQDWQEHIRPRLLDAHDLERRVNFDRYREYRSDCARQGLFLSAAVVGAFDLITPMCGHVTALTGMAIDPEWMRDMAEVYTSVTIHLLELLFEREGPPDALWVWDDLGYKRHPFMSPRMYRELIFPSHHRLFGFARARNLPVILHSDGLITPLIPHLIEAGIDALQPLEVKAGMDLRELKTSFGDRIALIGGMDARALISNDPAQVRRELESKLPAAMAGSGYVLQVDHSVPPQVRHETYRSFVEDGLKLGSY